MELEVGMLEFPSIFRISLIGRRSNLVEIILIKLANKTSKIGVFEVSRKNYLGELACL
jgi:hypothetical protein